MIKKLWSLEFVSELSSESGGVVVLEDGNIIGGSNNYFYIGSYDLVDNTFNATIDIKHYQGAYNPIFSDKDELIIKLDGEFHESEMLLTGYVLEIPSLAIHVRLKYHTELFHK